MSRPGHARNILGQNISLKHDQNAWSLLSLSRSCLLCHGRELTHASINSAATTEEEEKEEEEEEQEEQEEEEEEEEE